MFAWQILAGKRSGDHMRRVRCISRVPAAPGMDMVHCLSIGAQFYGRAARLQLRGYH